MAKSLEVLECKGNGLDVGPGLAMRLFPLLREFNGQKCRSDDELVETRKYQSIGNLESTHKSITSKASASAYKMKRQEYTSVESFMPQIAKQASSVMVDFLEVVSSSEKSERSGHAVFDNLKLQEAFQRGSSVRSSPHYSDD